MLYTCSVFKFRNKYCPAWIRHSSPELSEWQALEDVDDTLLNDLDNFDDEALFQEDIDMDQEDIAMDLSTAIDALGPIEAPASVKDAPEALEASASMEDAPALEAPASLEEAPALEAPAGMEDAPEASQGPATLQQAPPAVEPSAIVEHPPAALVVPKGGHNSEAHKRDGGHSVARHQSPEKARPKGQAAASLLVLSSDDEEESGRKRSRSAPEVTSAANPAPPAPHSKPDQLTRLAALKQQLARLKLASR